MREDCLHPALCTPCWFRKFSTIRVFPRCEPTDSKEDAFRLCVRMKRSSSGCWKRLSRRHCVRQQSMASCSFRKLFHQSNSSRGRSSTERCIVGPEKERSAAAVPYHEAGGSTLCEETDKTNAIVDVHRATRTHTALAEGIEAGRLAKF